MTTHETSGNNAGNEIMNGIFFLEKVRDEAIIQLKTISGKSAADIGAGTGFMSEGLLDADLKVTAVESSPESVSFMKEKFADIKEFAVIHSGYDAIKLPDESVDYAFANMLLHNTVDPLAVIREMARILKTGGKAAVTDFIFHSHSEEMKDYNHRWPGFTFPDLYDWFIAAGFKNISIEKTGYSCTCPVSEGRVISIDIFLASGEK